MNQPCRRCTAGGSYGQERAVKVLDQLLVAESLSLAHMASETQVEVGKVLLLVQPEQWFPLDHIHGRYLP